jgi:protein gp37
MGDTKIQWADKVWNPVRGCSPASGGCDHCYAAANARRFEPALVNAKGEFNGTVRCLPERLEQPMHWREPKVVFACSMADVFNEEVPYDFIDKVFAVMALCPQHTFQVLTKRPERMTAYLAACEVWDDEDKVLGDTGIGNVINGIPHYFLSKCREKPGGDDNWTWIEHETAAEHGCDPGCGIAVPGYWEYSEYPQPILIPWPLPNVWLGTSVENQAATDERIPHLLKCPAAVRFLSCEPLIGPLDNLPLEGIDWVIVGGETGPGARLCKVGWIGSIVAQCRKAGVPAYVKQLGTNSDWFADHRGTRNAPEAWPSPLRLRQYPIGMTLVVRDGA